MSAGVRLCEKEWASGLGPQNGLHIIGGAFSSICASYISNYTRRMVQDAPRLRCHRRHPGPHKLYEAHYVKVRLLYIHYRRRIRPHAPRITWGREAVVPT